MSLETMLKIVFAGKTEFIRFTLYEPINSAYPTGWTAINIPFSKLKGRQFNFNSFALSHGVDLRTINGRHGQKTGFVFDVPFSEFNHISLDTLTNKRGDFKNWALGICSILPNGRHVWFLDFEPNFWSSPIPYSGRRVQPASEGDVNDYLFQENEPPGLVVASDHSFHYYAVSQSLSHSEWEAHMSVAKRWPFIGASFPKLQVLKGYGVLRVSGFESKLRRKYKPQVIGVFGKPHLQSVNFRQIDLFK